MSAPRVSILLPVYNREALIAQAVESVMSQTMSDWELIVVDDASTDRTREVLARYQSRLTLITQAHAGAYVARNRALQEAKGELIAFLDSDDRWLPQKLERQIPLFDNPETGLVYGNAQLMKISTTGRKALRRTFFDLYAPARGQVFEPLMRRNFIPQSSVVVRRSSLQKTGPFSRTEALGADYAKWAQIALVDCFEYIQQPVFELSLHEGSLSRRRGESIGSQIRLFEEMAEHVIQAPQQEALRRRLLMLRWQFDWLRWVGKVQFKTVLDAPRKPISSQVPAWKRTLWYCDFLRTSLVLFLKLISPGERAP